MASIESAWVVSYTISIETNIVGLYVWHCLDSILLTARTAENDHANVFIAYVSSITAMQ